MKDKIVIKIFDKCDFLIKCSGKKKSQMKQFASVFWEGLGGDNTGVTWSTLEQGRRLIT